MSSLDNIAAAEPLERRPDLSSSRILVADDQPDVREALRLLLKAEGYRIEAVSNPGAALAALETQDFDILLIDLNYARDTTSGREGLELLSRIQAIDSSLPVIVMTAWEASRSRWRPCAAALATLSRSRGKTSACSASCAPSSS